MSRQVQSVTISREIKVSDSHNTAQVIVGLVVIALGAVAAYFLVGLLFKIAGWILLAAMMGLGSIVLFTKHGKTGLDDESKPMVVAFADGVRKNNSSFTDEQAYNAMLILALVMIVGFILSIVTVVTYATVPAYQHFPMNLIGLGTVVLLGIQTARSFGHLLRLPAQRTEPAKPTTAASKALGYTIASAMIIYPLCILAVDFGVL